MVRPGLELTQRVWFDDEQRLVPVAFFDYEKLDDPRIDDETERAIVLERTRRQLIAAMRKNGCGRRGLPRECVEFMHKDYKRVGSLSRVVKFYRRTRQAMWDIFKRHRLPMNERKFGARIVFDGRTWTYGKDGFRETGRRNGAQLLHRAIWEKRTGRKIPSGYQVTFRNGDDADFSSRNLVCLPASEVTLLHYRRRYPERGAMSSEQRRDWWKEHFRKYAARRSAAWVSQGLRSDGRPRIRRGDKGRQNGGKGG